MVVDQSRAIIATNVLIIFVISPCKCDWCIPLILCCIGELKQAHFVRGTPSNILIVLRICKKTISANGRNDYMTIFEDMTPESPGTIRKNIIIRLGLARARWQKPSGLLTITQVFKEWVFEISI